MAKSLVFKEKSKLVFLILIIGLLTLLQSFGFSILSIKPNIALVAIIAVSFFTANLWHRIFLVVLSAIILKFAPGFEKEILTFCLIGVTLAVAKDYLPWHHFLNNLFLVAAGTIIFYLILAPNLILSVIFLEELFLNLVFGALFFALLGYLWQNGK